MKHVLLSIVLFGLIACNPGIDTPAANCPTSSSQKIPPFSEILVKPNTFSLAVGEKTTFIANARDFNLAVIAPQPKFVWTSSNPSVASIDPCSFEVTAKAEGNTTISATYDGVTGKAVLTVGGSGGTSVRFVPDATYNGLSTTLIPKSVSGSIFSAVGSYAFETKFETLEAGLTRRISMSTAAAGLAFVVGASYRVLISYGESNPSTQRIWNSQGSDMAKLEAQNGKTYTWSFKDATLKRLGSAPTGTVVVSGGVTFTAP